MKLPLIDIVDATTTYKGEIEEGAGTVSEPVCTILRLTTTDGVTVTEAPFGPSKKATTFPIFVWDDRAKYAYGTGVDTTPPTITSLPSWGGGVASGSTTAKSVTFGDSAGGTAPRAISINASGGASITGFTGAYGACAFNLVAPINLTQDPVTIIITYSVTDQVGNNKTTTQNVIVAPAFVDAIQPIDLNGVNISSPISEVVTIANEPVKVTVGNPDIGGAVIATTLVFSTDITVSGTSSATADSYSGDITIQNEQGAVAVISIGLVVSEPI